MKSNSQNLTGKTNATTRLTIEDAEAIARLAPAYLTKINEKGQIQYINRDFGKYTIQDIQGISIFDIIDVGYIPMVKNTLKRTFSGHIEIIEFSVSGIFNETHHFRAFFAPVKEVETKNNFKNAILAILDISENKKIATALKESELRYKTLADLAFEGLLIYEGERIVDCNNTFLKLSGFTREEIIGADIMSLIHTKEEKNLFKEKTNIDNIVPYELTGKTKSGAPIAIELQLRFFIQDGKERKALAFRDISKRKKNETELKKLYTAIEQSPSSIVITNTQGDIEYVNPAFTETTGYTQEEARGANPRVLKTEYHQASYYETLWETITSGKVWNGEFRNKTKSGELYWEKATISPVFDNNHKITHFLAIKENITKQKQAIEALRKSEERHRIISEMISDFVYKIDLDKDNRVKMSWTSGAFKKITGYSIREINTFKDNWSSIVHPDDKDTIIENVIDNLNNKEGLKLEYRIIAKNGAIKWLSDLSRPIWDNEQNKLIGHLGAVSDITIRKETENTLIESEAQKNLILQKIPDLIFVFDRKGKFLNVYNDSEKDLLLKPKKFINKYIYEILPKTISDNFYTHIRKAFKTGEIQKYEYDILIKGQLSYYEARLIVSGKDEIVVVVRNITERKKSEEKLKEAMEEAEKANRSKSAFLANISHEIRTPINAVLGFAEILLSRITKQTSKRYLNSIISSGKTLLNLVNDILDLSKIEAGKMGINLKPVQLKTIFEEVNNIFSLQAEEKNLDYQFEYSEHIPTYIELDEFRMRQVLLNLVDNAIKFTEDGFIKIRANLLDLPNKKDDNHISLIIEVIDSGIGIHKNDQERLFTAFVQKDDLDKRKYGGTGLGLAISKQLTEMMNGTLKMESSPGQGTTFRLVFNNIKNFSDKELLQLTSEDEKPGKSLKKRIKRLSSKSQKRKKTPDIMEIPLPKDKAELIVLLKEIYDKKWKETSQTASFSSIKKFAEEIGNLGIEYNNKKLLYFSNELLDYTESFDIDNINALLYKFPLLIKNI